MAKRYNIYFYNNNIINFLIYIIILYSFNEILMKIKIFLILILLILIHWNKMRQILIFQIVLLNI